VERLPRLVKASVVLAVGLLAGVAGCASTTTGQNPNLLAPKLVVQPRPDGNVTLYVHGAFRDQTYEWLSLAVDNRTPTNRTQAFSIEENVAGPGFFVSATAEAGGELYQTQARIDVNATSERVHVAFLDPDGWTEPKAYSYPFEHVLDRPRVVS
jgi:hypothetical protein